MLKERVFLAFSVMAAGVAGYGTMTICWWLAGGFEGSLSPLLGLAVGLGALALMIRGVAAIRAERLAQKFSPPANPLASQ